MVVADRLTKHPRSAVHHKPQPAILIRLNFDEVITAAERGEFDRSFLPADCVETRMAERVCQLRGLRDDRAAVAAARWHSQAQVAEDLAGGPRIVQGRDIKIQPDSQHATADVTSHCLRIDETGCGDGHADADVSP